MQLVQLLWLLITAPQLDIYNLSNRSNHILYDLRNEMQYN